MQILQRERKYVNTGNYKPIWHGQTPKTNNKHRDPEPFTIFKKSLRTSKKWKQARNQTRPHQTNLMDTS